MATDQDTELPIDSDSPNYTMGIVIENIGYTFAVIWNEGRPPQLAGAWYFDLLDESGDTENPIASGIKIVLGALLGGNCTDPRFPNGAFFASDISGKNADATINDLGTRVKVYFRPASAFV